MIKGDFIVIILIIVIAIVLFILPIVNNANEQDLLIVKINDNTVYYDLNIDKTYELENNGYHLTLVIENKSAYVSESDCPDGTCRAMGSISKSNQFLACVPAGIYIGLEGSRVNENTIAG